jgi:hypothetical protein
MIASMIDAIAKVAMNEFTFRTVTINPFAAPTAMPMANVTITAIHAE